MKPAGSEIVGSTFVRVKILSDQVGLMYKKLDSKTRMSSSRGLVKVNEELHSLSHTMFHAQHA